MSDAMRQQLQEVADRSDRSLNAEIISRLHVSLKNEQESCKVDPLSMSQDLQSLRRDLDSLLKQQQETANMVSRIANAIAMLGEAGK